VGGFAGTVLAGLFASETFGGNREDLSVGRQLGVQLLAAGIAVVYTAAMSFGLLKLADTLVGLRVEGDQEGRGLDLSLHEESGYNF
jgi:Amt family ammonium transporter